VEQIQYDRESGISEKLSIKLSSPATSGSFLISRLFADEGEGANNHESGSWVAKLNGIVVASGEFDGEGLGRGNRGEFDIDTGGFAFDEIVFSANEYSQGLQDDREKDSSDYFVEGIEVEASNNFAVLETTDPSNPTSLEIPQSTIFSQLDDSNNRSYQLTASSLTNSAAGVVAIENGKIVFKAASGFIGSTTIEFEVTDQDNNVKVGVINVDVKETPEPATVETLNADNVAVSEGDDLLFTVELDKVTLSETTLDFQLTSTGGDILDDIHLDQLTFTNGVKYTFNADGSGQFVIPESVGEFEIYLPTNNAGDGNRGISLTVAAHETTVYLADDIDTLSETDTATDDVELLIGSENDDVLEALGGNDILIGGLGNDILKGGDGEDIFKWLDQSLPRNDHDIVSDFELGTDKIDVSDLLSQDADLNALLGLVEIIKQDDNSVSITLPIESGDELNLTLTNNSVAQFDSYSAGQISGDALNHLVTDIFVNLPE
ncbi:MAG TPA: calcium-binding protein, partial [Vibrio sp.]|nr:calcium-binding protein [Vibrio sp.]